MSKKVIRAVGDFGVAEDALQEAFAAALVQWSSTGPPRNAVAWLVAAARHKLDILRHQRVVDKKRAQIADVFARDEGEPEPLDTLRLIFTCCHPALGREAQLALTLKTVCGLSTEQVARAFVLGVPTVAQRLVRAKAKIEQASIPYEVQRPLSVSGRAARALPSARRRASSGVARDRPWCAR